MIHAPDVLHGIALAIALELFRGQGRLDRIDALDLALAVVRRLVDQIHIR